ncbi:LexA/Signal peptidase [Lindgomyces ingoldianus]|uniref:LexA/Signal peptidase n=1 Tax=Lindgomyces ingoldianus TaxID=673940 RepID=A0ACB6R7P2_9PLEO|nr:LexA/Signal peptidase [Lindgomyces ingoldianus]KAF2475201.1 LexA/Signal peptidase [Lindgomyces ingoldianus]
MSLRATSALLTRFRARIPPSLRVRRVTDSGHQRTLFGHAVLIAELSILTHLTFKYLFSITPTNGISMMPTIPHSYRHSPLILTSHLHRRGRRIKVGDIITYQHPIIPHSAGAKRVIGMPGDFVSVVTPGRDEFGEEGEFGSVREELIRVPEGHCWVAGDNLEWSRDSRVFGPVPLALVKGKVVALILPWGQRRWFGDGVEDVKDMHGVVTTV